MKKILIIEDDKVLRGELKILLGANGYETEEVTDFENTADRVLAVKPDLVLLDIILPGANGQMILREIRAKSDVPVIMLTSRNEDVDEIVSRSSGAGDEAVQPDPSPSQDRDGLKKSGRPAEGGRADLPGDEAESASELDFL